MKGGEEGVGGGRRRRKRRRRGEGFHTHKVLVKPLTIYYKLVLKRALGRQDKQRLITTTRSEWRRGGGEGGRDRERERGKDGEREGGRESGRGGGKEGGRARGREREREGEREGGRGRGRKRGRRKMKGEIRIFLIKYIPDDLTTFCSILIKPRCAHACSEGYCSCPVCMCVCSL